MSFHLWLHSKVCLFEWYKRVLKGSAAYEKCLDNTDDTVAGKVDSNETVEDDEATQCFFFLSVIFLVGWTMIHDG